jgi:YD repeat-containing protein
MRRVRASVTGTTPQNGNLTGKADARGIKTTLAYDALNRLVSKTYSDSTPAVTYVYDDPAIPHSAAQLTQVANGNSVTKYLGFDALGRTTSSQQLTSDETYTFSYSYNLAGALTSETYPSGRVVSTGYDGANRPSAVTGMLSAGQTTYASGVTYAPHGGIAGFAMGNGITPWFGYNNRLQVRQHRRQSAPVRRRICLRSSPVGAQPTTTGICKARPSGKADRRR